MNRRFREVRDRAQQGTVTITHHGKPSLVVLSVDQFRTLTASASSERVRRKLSLMLDNLDEGYFSLDADLVIDGVNRSAESFVGSGRDEMIGRPFTTVFPDGAETLFQAQQSINTGQILTRERQSERYPNRRVSVTTFPWPGPNGGVAILFANLTELERSRTACAEHDATLDALLGSLDSAIVLVTRGDVIERWGRGAERFLGWSAAEVTGRPLARILKPGSEPGLLHFVVKDGSSLAVRGTSTAVAGESDLTTLVYRPAA